MSQHVLMDNVIIYIPVHIVNCWNGVVWVWMMLRSVVFHIMRPMVMVWNIGMYLPV